MEITPNTWLTDRSRYTEGTSQCAMSRYLHYHAGKHGFGWARRSTALPLATGLLTHKALELILKSVIKNGQKVPERDEVRSILADATAAFRTEVQRNGLLDIEGSDEVLYTLSEQSALVEGLVWGWWKVILPDFLTKFEVICAEQEEFLDLGDGITQMSRPDFVCRRRQDRELGIHDFKTSKYSVTEETVEEYRSSVQMAVGTLGVERRLGQPVGHYYVHSLLKGTRREFSKKDRKSNGPRQYSPICYAKVDAANPPFSEISTPELGGYWIDKSPTWLMDLADKPKDFTPIEYWIELLPKEVLFETFTLIGPYERPKALIEGYLNGVRGEEKAWRGRISLLQHSEAKHGWASEEFQKELFELVPPSWKCMSWAGKCQFIPICFRHPGWKQLGNDGKFFPREPHHEAEVEQVKGRLDEN